MSCWARACLVAAAAVIGPSAAHVSSCSADHVDANPSKLTLHSVPLNPEKHTLKLVQVVFRHGARTPLAKAPNMWKGVEWDVCGPAYQGVDLALTSPVGGPRTRCAGDERQISGKLEGGCHRGELTKVGQNQALALGQWLRKRYVDEMSLLPYNYEDGAVASRSTNYQRTIGTLRGVLTGLYPAATRHLPATISSELDEILVADSKSCPHLALFSKQAGQSLEVMTQQPALLELKEKLQQLLPMMGQEFWDDKKWLFTDVHDVMTSLRTHGKPLPEGITEDVLLAVNRAATVTFRKILAPSLSDNGSETMLRLSLGRLMDILMNHMERVGRGAGGCAPMYLYSGHDSTILPLLAAMGHDVELWPPYLSNLIFELWEEKPEPSEGSTASPSRHFVRVLYNQEELALPGFPSGHIVDLQTFRDAVLGPFLISEQDLKSACHMTPSHDTSMPLPAFSASSLAGNDSEEVGQE